MLLYSSLWISMTLANIFVQGFLLVFWFLFFFLFFILFLFILAFFNLAVKKCFHSLSKSALHVLNGVCPYRNQQMIFFFNILNNKCYIYLQRHSATDLWASSLNVHLWICMSCNEGRKYLDFQENINVYYCCV